MKTYLGRVNKNVRNLFTQNCGKYLQINRDPNGESNSESDKKLKPIKKKKLLSLKLQAEAEARKNKNPGHIEYGFTKNYLFKRIKKTALLKPYYNNLRDAVMFGQKLVIDIGFEDTMNTQEINNCFMQISHSFDAIRINKEPYHLHLCNAKMDGMFVEKLQKQWKILQPRHPLVQVTEKSYLELFPKNQLVYLSPHCNETLNVYNHDDIYIIGGFVGSNKLDSVFLAKAKEQNLHVAKLPLEKYLRWSSSSELTIDQTVKILLTMKDTMDWKNAFQHVPSREIDRYL